MNVDGNGGGEGRTQLFILVNEQDFLVLTSLQPPEEVLADIQAGRWQLPEPLAGWAARTAGLEDFQVRAMRQGRRVMVAIGPRGEDSKAAGPWSPPVILRPRGQQVLQLVAEGLTTRQIAARLRISPRTVENYLAEMKQALGTATRAELLLRAAELGLCRPGRSPLRRVEVRRRK